MMGIPTSSSSWSKIPRIRKVEARRSSRQLRMFSTWLEQKITLWASALRTMSRRTVSKSSSSRELSR